MLRAADDFDAIRARVTELRGEHGVRYSMRSPAQGTDGLCPYLVGGVCSQNGCSPGQRFCCGEPDRIAAFPPTA